MPRSPRQLDHRLGVAVDQGVAVVGDQRRRSPSRAAAASSRRSARPPGRRRRPAPRPCMRKSSASAPSWPVISSSVARHAPGSCRCRMSTRSTPSAVEALLERAPGLGGVEAPGLEVAVELGREHAAPPASRRARAPPRRSAPRCAPCRRCRERVEEAVRQRQHRPDRRQRPLLVDVVAVGVGHVADARACRTRSPAPTPRSRRSRASPPCVSSPCTRSPSSAVSRDRPPAAAQADCPRRRAAPASARRCASSRSRSSVWPSCPSQASERLRAGHQRRRRRCRTPAGRRRARSRR